MFSNTFALLSLPYVKHFELSVCLPALTYSWLPAVSGFLQVHMKRVAHCYCIVKTAAMGDHAPNND